MASEIVLASGSVHRRHMLENAGLRFSVHASQLDERALEAPLKDSGATPDAVAEVLAEAKAGEVSERFPRALVIGADQTLALGDQTLHKPADMEAARRALLQLQGRTHELHSAVALVRGGQTLWRHVSTARLTMRELTPAEIGRYLALAGEAALGSVGAYQIEGPGIRLMSRVEGDLFTIIGLPLLPLLAELRAMGEIDV
ncbi:Maf-like protein [Aureimonas jatrophae]|uniref:Nucleoside triphosphate pyrophosphatase n=1 Tax=Aureimonas jatrophae TaxID=1166073 RepID=A0A1H0K641_9HYPH|nr:Maf-like protein [Aureimonas jatrophae]MBB3950966.1 septum formation protein [Aureimonas jatrophae]SDO51349.1 septum formation protein [Aureimonas jatrophae]